jgi:hypothetical protein
MIKPKIRVWSGCAGRKKYLGREERMNLKDILLILDEGTPSETRLQLATNIAQEHQACLSAVFLQNDRAARPPHELAAPWLGLIAGRSIPGTINTTQSATLAEIAEQRFRDCLRSPQVRGDWYRWSAPPRLI